ncbi:hypothetical protein [Cobetia crustatorum]|uniref:hypothetical protein n=1 Tax=Cobetia crustatorum TaxID=553385 RepID=UPI00046A33BF|nr:hypothetical protein [Cobetia crustatorum]
MLNKEISKKVDAIKDNPEIEITNTYEDILSAAIYFYSIGNKEKANYYGTRLLKFDLDEYGCHWLLKTTSNNEGYICDKHNLFSCDRLRLGKVVNKHQKDYLKYIKNLKELNDNLPIHKDKVAVCITGQVRGFELTKKSIMDNVVDNNNSDIFICVWDSIGGMPTRFIQQTDPNIKKLIKRINPKNIKELFPEYQNYIDVKYGVNKKYILTQFSDIESKSLEILSEDHFEFSGDFELYNNVNKNQEKLFYTINNAMLSVLEQEKQQGYRYRYIIKLRPDKKIVDKIDLTNIERGQLYFNNNESFGPGDQTAIGFRNDMIVFMCFYDYFKNNKKAYIDLFNDNYRIASHDSIGQFLWSAGLNFSRYSGNTPNGRLHNMTMSKDELYSLPIFSYFDKILTPTQKQRIIKHAAAFDDEISILIKSASLLEKYDIDTALKVLEVVRLLRPNRKSIQDTIKRYNETKKTLKSSGGL